MLRKYPAMDNSFPAAPWSVFLKGASAVILLLLLGAGYAVARGLPMNGDTEVPRGALLAALSLVVVGAGLCVVVSYQIHGSVLRIRRLLWHTTINLADLQQATLDPEALRDSFRLFGNGGMFSFTGYYRNRQLGTYRAFVTDWQHAVVLRLSRRVIVVSPAEPAAFLRELRRTFPRLGNEA